MARWGAKVRSLAAIFYADTAKAAMLIGTDTVPVIVAPVSADFFPVLHGGAPLLGRWFTAADEGDTTEVAAVVSERFWQRVSGGDPALVGQRWRWPGGARAIVVVGIAPAGFDYPHGTDLWLAGDPVRHRAP